MSHAAPEATPPVSHRNEVPDTTAPDGSEIRLLIDERRLARRASLCEVTLPAGQVSRPVWHQTVEEIWYVLEGRGRVWRCSPMSAAGPGHQPQETVEETTEEEGLARITGGVIGANALTTGALTLTTLILILVILVLVFVAKKQKLIKK